MIDATVSQNVLIFLGQIAGDLGPLSFFGDALADKRANAQVTDELESLSFTVNQQMTEEAEGLMNCLATPSHRMMIEQLTDKLGGRSEAFGRPFRGRLHYLVMTRPPQGGTRLRWPVTPEAIFAMFLPLSMATPSGCTPWTQRLEPQAAFALLGAVEQVRARRIRASLPFGPSAGEINRFDTQDVVARLSEIAFDRPPFGGIQGAVAQGLNLRPVADLPSVQPALDELAQHGIIAAVSGPTYRLGPALEIMAERLATRQDRLLFWLARLHQGAVEQSKLCVLIGQAEPSYVFEILRGDGGRPAIQLSAVSSDGLGRVLTSLYLDYAGDDEAPRPERPTPQSAAEVVFCEHCGARLPADARFCDVCGKAVTP